LKWLESAQNPDGGWGSRSDAPTDLAASASVEWTHFVRYCSKRSAPTTSRLVGLYKRNQNPDGGLPKSVGGVSSVLATSSFIRVLLAAGELRTERSVRQAVAWLVRTQSPKGYWEEPGNGDASELIRSASAIEALLEAGLERASTPITQGIDFILQEVRDTKLGKDCSPCDLALATSALVHAGFSGYSVVVLEPLNDLLKAQREDGGWPAGKTLSSQVGSTVLVLNALLDAGFGAGSDAVERGVGFILSQKNADGAWAGRWSEPSVPHTTAGVLALLCRLR
jgi:squalene cyclase